MTYEHLLQPIRLGDLELRNRVVMGSMHTGLEDKPWDVPRLEVYRALRRLTRACAKGDTAAALSAIRLAVSDYVPSDAVIVLSRAGAAAEAGRAGEAGGSSEERRARL